MYEINRRNPLCRWLKEEDYIQNAVMNYIESKYKIQAIPCNTESGKTPFEQLKFKVMGGRTGILDLFVPVAKGGYHGLFLELKKEGAKVFKKNGDVIADKTIKGQYEQILIHRSNGYMAEFGIGLDDSTRIVDEYFNLKLKT